MTNKIKPFYKPLKESIQFILKKGKKKNRFIKLTFRLRCATQLQIVKNFRSNEIYQFSLDAA